MHADGKNFINIDRKWESGTTYMPQILSCHYVDDLDETNFRTLFNTILNVRDDLHG